MAQTEYLIRARSKGGRLVESKVKAGSEAEALSVIKQQGATPISVEMLGQGLNKEIRLTPKRVTKKDLAIMTRQMSTMLAAGLPILRALTILSEQTPNPTLKERLTDVRQDVEQGLSFSDALALHDTFPPIMISMVRAGETGGFLDSSMLQIAEIFETDVKLRGTIKAALTYPIAVGFVAFVIVMGMLLFIVPIFGNMFAELGGELPLPTQIMLSLSSAITNPMIMLPLTVLLLALFITYRRVRNRSEVRDVMDPLKFKVPVFGGLMKKVALARFTRNFSALLHAGVPILTALDIVGDTSGNVVISRAIEDVKESVRTGSGMAAPFARHDIFPAMVVQMIAVGEDTGELDAMLSKIADFYDAEAQSTTEQLTSLIEPIMIVGLGITIGAMVISLYLPIFNIYELMDS